MSYVSQHSLLSHIQRQHCEQGVHICDVCEKSFPNVIYLKTHKRRQHGGATYSCEYCNMPFTLKSNCERHMLGCGLKLSLYRCEVEDCPKSFSTPSNLKRHMLNSHSSSKPVKKCVCEVCSKAFSYPSNLKEHMRTHTGEKSHTGEKPQDCGICGQMFANLNDLQQHLRIHTGEKP